MLFTGNNLLTLGVLRAVHERRLKVPDDIAVAAFDEMDWMCLVYPALPIVSQPAHEIGRTAARLLLARIADATREPQEVMLRAVMRLPRGTV